MSPQYDTATDPGRVLAAVMPPPIGCSEAERAVPGGLLSLPAVEARAVTDHLRPADFTDPRHAAILDAVIELTSDGTSADPITGIGQLGRTNAVAS